MSLISEIITLECKIPGDIYSIDNLLSEKYGSVLRWAIVVISANKLKICLTYEKEV